jgi:methyltransferase-like protein/2-polyprenyl-3-methyl-5-hydroxy-6-metoxy-1,4-benzoquinol methylase
MDAAQNRFSHDELHYLGMPYPQTHPDWLCAVGTLCGMRPAPVDRCRVLELACGDGNNIIPMAYTLPGSTFCGMDFAAEPLAAGQRLADAVGLPNLRLEVRDILDFPAGAGEFDYIIAHGFYSWCPPAVRERLLGVCAEHLSPQGIAFVSFNAYPGYHRKDLERNLILFHLAHTAARTPAEQAREALGALDFVANSQPGDNGYRAALKAAREEYAQQIEKSAGGPAWFHHDLLATFNAPAYFHQFMDHAGRHRLQFVCDGTLRLPRMLPLPPETLQVLQSMQEDVISQEQYLDFILCPPFRLVLLCRDDVALDRTCGPQAMRDLLISARLSPEKEGETEPGAPELFVCPKGSVSVSHPDGKAALHQLRAAWPRGISFRELAEGQSSSGTAEGLAEFLLRLCVNHLAAIRSRESIAALKPGVRPEASAVARKQAGSSMPVANLYHEEVKLELASRHLLGLLDGTRNRSELAAGMRAWILSGQAGREHGREKNPAARGTMPSLHKVEADLEANLQRAAEVGLLIG